jgi:hypothetical protein
MGLLGLSVTDLRIGSSAPKAAEIITSLSGSKGLLASISGQISFGARLPVRLADAQ